MADPVYTGMFQILVEHDWEAATKDIPQKTLEYAVSVFNKTYPEDANKVYVDLYYAERIQFYRIKTTREASDITSRLLAIVNLVKDQG